MIDLARAVFIFNGVAQAAREIARETSVHPGRATIGRQRRVPRGRRHPARPGPWASDACLPCYDIEGVLQLDGCQSADWVRVTAIADFQPSLPLLTMLGPMTVSSTSSAEIQ